MGAAGIRAALLLEKAGVEVRLFEARDRVAGRLCTVTDNQGVAYDAGGEWVDADHYRTLDLARSLGVEPDPTPRWPGIVCFEGKTCKEDDLWNDALEDELRLQSAATELCRNIDSTPWDTPELSALDDVTLADFIRENATSDRGRWWLMAKYRSDEGDDPERIGLLGWLMGFKNYIGRDDDAASAFRLSGGMGRLFELASNKIKTPIQLEKALQRIVHDGRKVILQFEQGETTVDRLLLTMPPPALERIVFDPALPKEKRCAIEACEMSRIIKICMQFDSPWWEERQWSGSLICDMPVQQIWEGTKGTVPILNCYICGKDADYFLHNKQAVQAAISQLTELMPEASQHFVRGVMYDWVGDSFAYGAFPHMAPGFVMNHLQHISRPYDRIHFAGDYTANWFGFIEGALESAERAVLEIINA